MKALILAVVVSLTVPVYAQQGPDLTTCDELNQASERLANVIKASKEKDLPLSDEDKAQVKEALEQFDKAMKDFYAIGQKVAKKKGHPKLKTLGAGFLAAVGGLRSTSMTGYGSPSYMGTVGPNMLPPLMPMQMPMQNMMPTTFINTMPAAGQSPFTTITPMGGNNYSVFHPGGF